MTLAAKVLKSLLVWICFIPVAILNGGLREHVLEGALGEKWALPLSGMLLAFFIWLVTTLLFPRVVKNCSSGDCLLVGVFWTLLTAVFELLSGLSAGNSLAGLLSAYNPMTGNLWLLVLAATFFSPLIVTASRSRRARSAPRP